MSIILVRRYDGARDVLPLADAARAHEMMEAGRTLGEIVLVP